MTLRKQLKHGGKLCLHNNWGKAVAIVLLGIAIYLLFTMVETMISMLLGVPFYVDVTTSGLVWKGMTNISAVSLVLSLIMTIGSFIVVTPLNLGVTQWYYSLSEGESEDILSIFGCFSNRRMFFRSLLLRANIVVRSLLWAVVYFLIPGLFLGVSMWYGVNGPDNNAYLLGTMGMIFSFMLGILMSVFYMITIQKYFLARYYLLDGETSVHQALKMSRRVSRGKREQIFLFKLSYAGWFLTCLLVVPVLYVFPYYQMSALLYARFLMEEHVRSTQLVPVQPEEEPEIPSENEEN